MLTFKSLELSDKVQIENFVKNFEPYSDFNFISLYSWSLHSQTKFCLKEDCFYILMPDYITQKLFLSFLGKNIPQNLKEAIKYCENNEIQKKFLLLPKIVADEIAKCSSFSYKLESDRDGFDYIIDTKLVSEAKGGIFEDFRYKVSKFEREWGDKISIFDFDPSIRNHLIKATKLSQRWGEHKKQQGALFEDELYALTRFFGAAKISKSVRFKAIEHNNNIIAFVGYEILDNQYAIGHFLKYEPSFKGLYQLLIKLVCEDLKESGTPYINIEQDLGIATLRSAKMHLRPVKFLEKYTLEIQ